MFKMAVYAAAVQACRMGVYADVRRATAAACSPERARGACAHEGGGAVERPEVLCPGIPLGGVRCVRPWFVSGCFPIPSLLCRHAA